MVARLGMRESRELLLRVLGRLELHAALVLGAVGAASDEASSRRSAKMDYPHHDDGGGEPTAWLRRLEGRRGMGAVHKESVGVLLCRAVGVGAVEQLLHAQQNLVCANHTRQCQEKRKLGCVCCAAVCCAVLCGVHLLDGDGGLPVFVFIEDAQAHGARGVDVGVEETTRELACARTSRGASSQHGSVLLQKNEASLRAASAGAQVP